MKKARMGSFCYRTDRGLVRMTNEDQALVLINNSGNVFLVVADGIGGQAQGDLASKIAVDTLAEEFRNKSSFWCSLDARNWLLRAIRKANKAVFNEAQSNKQYKDMGTTLVVALVHRHRLIVANIGDSRAYLCDFYHQMRRLTEDQTFVDYLVKVGQLDPKAKDIDPRRHVLVNALGVSLAASIDIKSYRYRGETILLCSDGLYNNIIEPHLADIISAHENIETRAEKMIEAANINGGSDNIAVALWEDEV
ncbi:MAG TPA: Stp1/IreP family PP2C-type Ser/Thr phosphatase [Bacilli bacterium]|nr:Stp1/IreP family PP2C-type Ser/Thr phosphatase [Bacilli bacterium]